MPSFAASDMQYLIDGIARDGYAVVADFMPAENITALADEAKNLLQAGIMRHARTGKNTTIAAHNLRGDFIHWLDEPDSAAPIEISASQLEYFARMQTLREQLNREFYLGLADIESHFTIYPPGAIYHKHLDQFRGSEQRQVSSILYLNHGWHRDHGGQLRMYLDDAEDSLYLDIEPIGGTLILFMSGRFWHEVLPATQQRISLTGWFRTRD